MPQSKHIVIVAGEESGDIHAAHLIEQLLHQDPSLKIAGIGGNHMQKAGATLLSNLASYAVTGFTEVLWHLRVFKKAMTQIQAYLAQTKPDLLILVDYPEFNLRLAKYAKQTLGLRIIYYISPQIWAWKPKRLQTIRDNVDHMAVILPFEKKIYQEGQVPVSFVGHPLIASLKANTPTTDQKHRLGLPADKRIIALLPGSRNNEIQRHLPVFIETIHRLSKQHADLHFVIPVAKTLRISAIAALIPSTINNISLIEGNAVPIITSSDCVVVASGTASLECALLGKPMCIVYIASWLSYLVATKVIKVKYLGLCNLLQNHMLVPELLQYDCNPTELTRVINQLLQDSDLVNKMRAGFLTLKSSLSDETIDETLLDLVTRYLHFPNTLSR